MKAVILNHYTQTVEIAPVADDLLVDGAIDYDAIANYLEKELGYDPFTPFMVVEDELCVYPWDSNNPIARIAL